MGLQKEKKKSNESQIFAEFFKEIWNPEYFSYNEKILYLKT